MSIHQAGKGDSPRPVNKELWESGWDRIFGKGKKNAKKSAKKAVPRKGNKK
jgi:hypothetical protein